MGWGDPLLGYCIYGREDISAEDASIGTEESSVPGKVINLRQEACEHFEPKASRRKFIEEGN
jgi:hypothetical protein